MESDIKLEVRQSILAVVFCIICVLIFEIVWGGAFIFLLIDTIKNRNGIYNNDTWVYISVLCFAGLISILVLILLAYIIYCYSKELDIYTNDKMYHTRGKKIIYELEYKDIVVIREWLMDTFMMFCEKPIVKKNGKIGPKTVWVYYKKADRINIMQLISKNYPNINILSYSNNNSDKN